MLCGAVGWSDRVGDRFRSSSPIPSKHPLLVEPQPRVLRLGELSGTRWNDWPLSCRTGRCLWPKRAVVVESRCRLSWRSRKPRHAARLRDASAVSWWQILLQHKYLEQQQVGEMAMVPSSDARERLYRLLKDRCGRSCVCGSLGYG